MKPPLYVDLDGTLIHSDSLWDSVALLLRRHPLRLFLFPLWFLKGRAFLKKQIQRLVSPDASLLPYREDLLAWLRQEKANGRKIILATAAHEKIAHAVARHLGCFDAVLASDAKTNLKGSSKLKAIREDAGGDAFVYAGDSSADIPIWNAAQGVVLAGRGSKFAGKLKNPGNVEKTFANKKKLWRSVLHAIRPHQWIKNILVFLPLLAAHELGDMNCLARAVLLFLAFSFCASSVYLLNDLVDLENDRAHAQKRSRPFAAGTLPVPMGVLLGVVFFVVGGALGVFAGLRPFAIEHGFAGIRLDWGAAAVLLIYWVLTFVYSFYLKRRVLFDVFALSFLYLIRAVAGATLVANGLSEWMTAFLLFFFLSLAFAKRFSELHHLSESGARDVKGRGYLVGDKVLVGIFGIVSAFVSVLIVDLYITSDAMGVLYSSPRFLWGVSVLILFWLCRIWLFAWRGWLHQDPIVFAWRDRGTWITGLLAGVLVYAAAN